MKRSQKTVMEKIALVLGRFCERLEVDLWENQRLLKEARAEVDFRKRMGYLLRFFSGR